jgi:hypothetical protein
MEPATVKSFITRSPSAAIRANVMEPKRDKKKKMGDAKGKNVPN